jgi:hypothetical protein
MGPVCWPSGARASALIVWPDVVHLQDFPSARQVPRAESSRGFPPLAPFGLAAPRKPRPSTRST